MSVISPLEKLEMKHRIAALEAELKAYRETEWDRMSIRLWMHISPVSVQELAPGGDFESLTEEECDNLFRQEYYRRVAEFEAARGKAASTSE